MTNVGIFDDHTSNVIIKRKSNKKAGFEVERREEDGFYYITKVPKNCTKIGVGDRVLEINGTMHKDFKSQTNANDLVDSIRLEVATYEVPTDDDDDQEDNSEEEYEEVDRSRSKAHNIRKIARMTSSEVDSTSRSKNAESRSDVTENDSDNGDDWNNGSEMKCEEPEWDNENFNNNYSQSSKERAVSKREKDESWDREYISQYQPNERFMISVCKREGQSYDDLGIDLVEYREGEIYVSEVNRGPFYETALYRGDRIITINGKKIPGDLNSVEEAMDIIHSSPKITLFVLRPEENDEGYNWVHEHA